MANFIEGDRVMSKHNPLSRGTVTAIDGAKIDVIWDGYRLSERWAADTLSRIPESLTVAEIDSRLSNIIHSLAGYGMKHELFDNVYMPLLSLRDKLVPGKYS